MDLCFPPNEASIHESFSFMLLERIESLEQHCMNLEVMVHNQQQLLDNLCRTKFFTLHMKSPLPPDGSSNINIKHVKDKTLDSLFLHRKFFLPIFAAWRWFVDITGTSLIVEVAICVAYPLTSTELCSYLNHDVLDVCQISELYHFTMLVTSKYTLHDISVNVWHHVHPTSFYPMVLGDVNFTESKEYLDVVSPMNQELLFVYIHVLKAWTFLLGI